MEWYYEQNGQEQGPVSEQRIQGLIKTGVVQKTTKVWNSTMQNWQPAGTTELASLFATPKPPPLNTQSKSSSEKKQTLGIFAIVGIIILWILLWPSLPWRHRILMPIIMIGSVITWMNRK